MISSPTRTSSGSSSRGRSAEGLVNLDNVLEGGTTQQCRGTISVSIRLKPSDTNTRSPWYASDDHTIVHNDLGEFWFDKVFSPQTNNYGVYEEIGKPMIDKLFQGYNATIFAYGMTGSGKTFTMSGTRDEAGLILLSVEQIFSQIMKESVNNKSYEVRVSYLEIYNEKIYDLLNYPSAKSPGGTYGSFQSKNVPGAGAELPVRDDARHGVRVVGLTEQQVHSSEDVLRKIELGNSNRRTGETDYNTRSSRSHAIVTIKVTCTELLSGTDTTSTLSLCDLAGSERAAGQHERRKEGAFINKSLLALGTVISKLSAVSGASGGGAATPPPTFGNSHVPYRDSKLTRILQPALSGDSIVTTICTIDTKPDAMSETVNTIRFASRAKNVSMTVKRNEAEATHDKDELLHSLRRQLDEQQDLICELRRAQPPADQSSCEATPLGPSATVLMLRRENETLKKKLQHCERLLDKDDAAVEDEQFVEIVEMLPPAVGALLESKIQGLESQLREHRAYTAQLEQRLSEAEAEARLVTQQARAQAQTLSGDDGTLQRVVREQEEELEELQRSLARKNKMLDALQSAKRLREGALRPLNRGLGAGAGAGLGDGRVAHKSGGVGT